MTRPFAVLLALTLAACGADGAPQPPQAATGVTLTGEAAVGVVMN